MYFLAEVLLYWERYFGALDVFVFKIAQDLPSNTFAVE